MDAESQCRGTYNDVTMNLALHGHVNLLIISDINECQRENGECQQVCVNEIGSHNCSCYEGYYLNSTDNRSCIS